MSDQEIIVELGPAPNAATIRACVEAIRAGGKVKPLEGASEALLHAVVRYANGLLAADVGVGEEMWQRVAEACDDRPEFLREPALDQQVAGIAVALVTASEYLLGAALALNPALAEILRGQLHPEEQE